MVIVYRDKNKNRITYESSKGFDLVQDPNKSIGIPILRLNNTYIDCPDPVAEFEHILKAIEDGQKVYWIKYDE